VEAAGNADCDVLPGAAVEPMIQDVAKAHAVEPDLLRAVIEQESGYRPCAVSSKGAQGLMQLMPATAAELGVADPFDPKDNMEGGARFLKMLLDKYKGDLAQALGAYNADPSRVDQAGGVPNILETRNYVDSILRKVAQ
jgi:soluble lytic murein transglycosylase-like protein